jgi:hypothetical protein
VGGETHREREDLGSQRGRTAPPAAEVGGAGERLATEPLESHEETQDVPVDQPVVLIQGVRRVRTLA